MIKRITYLIAIFACINLAKGQLKYKDVMELIRTKDVLTYYPALEKFKEENNQHPNAYYQAAKAQWKFIQLYDPILDQSKIQKAVYDANLFLELAKSFADEREFRKNHEWWDLLKEESDYNNAIFEIDKKIQKIKEFGSTYDQMIKHYEGAIVNYDSCLILFTQINSRFNNLRELYLKADEELLTKIEQVGLRFDSVTYHYDRYQANQKEIYPDLTTPELQTKPILFYRLNGLTGTSFLSSPLYIWDYGKWSDDFLENLSSEVELLRDQITKSYSDYLFISERLSKLQTSLITSSDSIKLDSRLFNLIRKYDNTSALIDFFAYCQSELTFLLRASHPLNFPAIHATINERSLARYYSSLQDVYHHTDSLRMQVSGIDYQDGFETFTWFARANFANADGYNEFVSVKEKELNSVFARSVKKYLEKLASSSTGSAYDKVISVYPAGDQMMAVNPADSLKEYRLEQIYQVDSSAYGAYGSLVDSAGSTAFVSYMVQENDTTWVRWLAEVEKSEKPYLHFLKDSSVIYGSAKEGAPLFHYASSEEITIFSPEENETLISLDYDDLFEEYFLATKIQDSTISENRYQFYRIDRGGNILWKSPVNFNGTFLRKITLNNDWVMFFNSKDDNFNSIGSNLLALTLDRSNGQMVDTLAYQAYDFVPVTVVKLNNEELNVLGSSRTPGNSQSSDEKDLPVDYFTIFSYDGKLKKEKKFEPTDI